MSSRRWASAGLEFALATAVALLALGVAMILVAASGAPPGEAASLFIEGAFGDPSAVARTVTKMVPLVLVALGWIVVYTAGRFHVGFPGQILLGGTFSAAVALQLDGLPAALLLPLCVLAGVAGGLAYSAVVGWLWAKRGVNEILSTLLLNLLVIQFVSWVVRGPLQERSDTLPQTDPLPEAALWPGFLGDVSLHWDLILIPIAVLALAFVMSRTSFGFRVRLVGASENVARSTGTSPVRTGVYAILVSGVLAGLAGSSLILAGETPGMTDNFDAGYGFQGIAVALLARNSPLGCIPAALLFAALRQGGGIVEAQLGVSSAIVGITQGIVITFVLAATSLVYVMRQRTAAPARVA